MRGDRHVARELLHGQDIGAAGRLADGHLIGPGRALHDLDEVLLGREGDVDLEEEPVELRLRQRVGALHLERVLGGQHEERLGQRVLLLRDGHPVLLHRLEQRRLRLRGGAVDLVGQDEVAEDRPLLEAEAALAALLDDDVRADDVGRHQVRRELDAAEAEVERLGHRADEHRLAQARDALQQRVRPGQQADQRLPHELVLPDDEATDLAFDRRCHLGELLGSELGGARWRLLGEGLVGHSDGSRREK